MIPAVKGNTLWPVTGYLPVIPQSTTQREDTAMCKRLITEFRAVAGAIATLTVVLCLSGSANAQSTDVGDPTPLTENSIRGTLEKAENNFYVFSAGPGEV